MSGFGGFVPLAKNHFGESYPKVTERALSPRRPHTTEQRSPRSNLPGYGGYLQGGRFEYGETFGRTVEKIRNPTFVPVKPLNKEMPGYKGFVRSGMHFLGATYGEATRQAQRDGYRFREGLVEHRKKLPKEGRCPGYTGMVHGAQDHFGTSYYNITKRLICKDA